jgi:hypothetical protein
MTTRERMLATIRGEPTDMIPWVPRLDLWYIALRGRGQLPSPFVGLNLVQVADCLGVGCHAVRGDRTISRDPSDLALRGLGIENHPDFPYRVVLRDLPIEANSHAGHFETTIRTGAGDVTMAFDLTRAMAQNGISTPFFSKRAIESVDDFEPVARIFEHLEVIPTQASYSAFKRRVGEAGIAVASGPSAASPMHLILHDLMAMDQFMFSYHDRPEEVRCLADRLAPFFEAVLDAEVTSEAEVVWWGANYDQSVTWPTFFAEEIAPWLQHVRARLHQGGKLLLTHADGELAALLPAISTCRVDVAESVCAYPMTRLTLAQLRDGMGATTTIWGGIPATALLDEVMDDRDFDSYLVQLFDDLGSGERLILGVSDNVPPDAKLERLARVSALVRDFGPVCPSSRSDVPPG